jgi:hypothetical protein
VGGILGGAIQVAGDVAGIAGETAISVGETFNGQIQIGGSLARGIELAGEVGEDAGNPAISIGGNLTGTVHTAGDMPKGIVVGGNVAGDLQDPAIRIDGSLGGRVHVVGVMARTIEVAGVVGERSYAPAISIDGDLTGIVQADGNVTRDIVIGGDVASTTADPAITIGGVLSGEIRILGSLYDVESHHRRIDVVDGMPDPPVVAGAITVNWDAAPRGYDEETGEWYFVDSWRGDATVALKDVDYYGNHKDLRIFWTSCAKGDFDGSGTTNNFDITPFVLALSDLDGYDRQYPGRVGAATYHGDCDCDENHQFNNFDITAFVMKITNPNLYKQTYHCEACGTPPEGGFEGEGSFDPAVVAAVLEEYLDPNLMPFLISVGEDIVANSPDDAEAEFWAAVLAELG